MTKYRTGVIKEQALEEAKMEVTKEGGVFVLRAEDGNGAETEFLTLLARSDRQIEIPRSTFLIERPFVATELWISIGSCSLKEDLAACAWEKEHARNARLGIYG